MVHVPRVELLQHVHVPTNSVNRQGKAGPVLN